MRYHWFPEAELELRVTDPPLQKVVGPPGVMFGVAGIGLTVTAAEPLLPDPGHPLDSVTETKVYVVEEAGVTAILVPLV